MGSSLSSSSNKYDEPLSLGSVYFTEFEAGLPDLTSKTVAITGCTSGTGLVAAKTCAKKGATVLMLNRPSKRAEAALEAVKKEAKGSVQHVDCDLMDFESVRKAARSVRENFEVLDVLCNNAGVMALEDAATKDGYDVQMQTNHLSHFLLTKELFPLLEKAGKEKGEARIVNHSSGARNWPPYKLDAKYLEKKGGNLGGNGNSMVLGGARWVRYHQTKLANAVFTLALKDKMPSNVKALVCAPGLATTNLQVTTHQNGGFEDSWIMRYGQSAEDGTIPLLTCMLKPDLDYSNTIYEPEGVLHLKGRVQASNLESLSTNLDSRRMLWDLSEQATGGPWKLDERP